jgi:His/Glu/Gln/Arg/opine family amino acid ABC transporter permease subunit
MHVWNSRWALLSGVEVMFYVVVASTVLSIAGGLVLAVARLSGTPLVRVPAFLMTQLCRGVPLYVLILWVFFGLAIAANIRLDPLVAGIAAIAFLNSGYMAEVFRAALTAVPEGQEEAARAVGLSPLATLRYVRLPQAVLIALPAASNVIIEIIKGTAILSVITVNEVLKESQRWADYYSAEFEFYTAAAALYAVIVLITSVLLRRVEAYAQRHLAGA